MRSRSEIELEAVKDAMLEHLEHIQATWTLMENEDRGPTPEEEWDVEQRYRTVKTVLEPRKKELENAISVERDVKRMMRDVKRMIRELDPEPLKLNDE